MAFLDKLFQMHYITIFSLLQQKTPEKPLARQEIVSFYKSRPFSLVIFIKGIHDAPPGAKSINLAKYRERKNEGTRAKRLQPSAALMLL